ncbi:hypothetical protein [Pseudomonas sp. NBRC 111124]|nr:hypothetical protein [Pseudomonas sp. NBRC 111124]
MLAADISREYRVDQVTFTFNLWQVAGDPGEGKAEVDKFLNQNQPQ